MTIASRFWLLGCAANWYGGSGCRRKDVRDKQISQQFCGSLVAQHNLQCTVERSLNLTATKARRVDSDGVP